MMKVKSSQIMDDLQAMPPEKAGELVKVAYTCAKGNLRHEELSRFVARPVSNLEEDPFYVKSEQTVADLNGFGEAQADGKYPIPSDAKFYTKKYGTAHRRSAVFFESYESYLDDLAKGGFEAVAEEMAAIYAFGDDWASPFVQKYNEYAKK